MVTGSVLESAGHKVGHRYLHEFVHGVSHEVVGGVGYGAGHGASHTVNFSHGIGLLSLSLNVQSGSDNSQFYIDYM